VPIRLATRDPASSYPAQCAGDALGGRAALRRGVNRPHEADASGPPMRLWSIGHGQNAGRVVEGQGCLCAVCSRIGYHSLSTIEIEPTPPSMINVAAFSAVENPGVS
jgi:hypothetical protein